MHLKGIEAPFWFRDTIINTVGFREAEKALQLGRLFSAEEALAINMVDEICEPKELMARAEQQMQIWGRIPSELSIFVMFEQCAFTCFIMMCCCVVVAFSCSA